MNFLFVDTETGGLNPEVHSLLTATFTVTDKDLRPLGTLNLKIKHDTYVVTAEALRINKINLIEHDKVATPIPTAQILLDNFIFNYGQKNNRLMLAGHNPGFDKDFIKNTFNSTVWNEVMSYHSLDSIGLGVILKMVGVLPEKQSLSLEPLAKAMGIPVEEFHTSQGDVNATINLVKKSVSLWKERLGSVLLVEPGQDIVRK